MYKPKIRFLLLFLFLILSVCIFACNKTDNALTKELQSIEVDHESVLNEYDIEDFTIDGMLLILHYDDGSIDKIPITVNMISTSDLALLSVSGTHTLTIRHESFTTALTLTMTYLELSQQLRFIYQLGFESDLITTTYEQWLLSIKGEDGISIVAITIDEHGHLIVTLSNNDFIDAGRVVGRDGLDGLSIYQIYLTQFPEYEKTVEQWLNDLINGRLKEDEKIDIDFEVMDGYMPFGYNTTITIDINSMITLPVPTKNGYEFMGWYTGFTVNDEKVGNATPITKTMTLYAKWTAIKTITFDSKGGTLIEPTIGAIGSPFNQPNDPEKEDFLFKGWFTDSNFETRFDQFLTIPNENITLYAKWHWNFHVNMVSVGEKTVYTIPTGTNNLNTATVMGGYLMATTETTYELWYKVRVWAESNGYNFYNSGKEGNNGTTGAAPTVRKLEPVTTISWRDIIVWVNALSEMTGLDPVYRTAEGEIIKDSRYLNREVVNAAIQTNNNGYRLPTNTEWEMAARWTNSSVSGMIISGGRYWTPGSYASGATADYTDSTQTQAVAWYEVNAGGKTQAVGLKAPNPLGIYDLNGNVTEYTYTTHVVTRIIRGGNFMGLANNMQISAEAVVDPGHAYLNRGFRVVRNP